MLRINLTMVECDVTQEGQLIFYSVFLCSESLEKPQNGSDCKQSSNRMSLPTEQDLWADPLYLYHLHKRAFLTAPTGECMGQSAG